MTGDFYFKNNGSPLQSKNKLKNVRHHSTTWQKKPVKCLISRPIMPICHLSITFMWLQVVTGVVRVGSNEETLQCVYLHLLDQPA